MASVAVQRRRAAFSLLSPGSRLRSPAAAVQLRTQVPGCCSLFTLSKPAANYHSGGESAILSECRSRLGTLTVRTSCEFLLMNGVEHPIQRKRCSLYTLTHRKHSTAQFFTRICSDFSKWRHKARFLSVARFNNFHTTIIAFRCRYANLITFGPLHTI